LGEHLGAQLFEDLENLRKKITYFINILAKDVAITKRSIFLRLNLAVATLCRISWLHFCSCIFPTQAMEKWMM
jgi:hypothetical protein